MTTGEWRIETDLPRDEIEAFLRENAPWRVDFSFPCGLRSGDFDRFEPFNSSPLRKLQAIERELPDGALAGRVLDVGFNCGYNSIHLSTAFGTQAVGIDVLPKHKHVADWLAAATGANVQFKLADAQTYCEPGAFSTVLHLGTLYHLPNPVLAIETAAENLRAGGWLALETVAYVGPGAEQQISKFIHGRRGDRTNYWALSKPTITALLELYGMDEIRFVRELPTIDPEEFQRVVLVSRRSESSATGSPRKRRKRGQLRSPGRPANDV